MAESTQNTPQNFDKSIYKIIKHITRENFFIILVNITCLLYLIEHFWVNFINGKDQYLFTFDDLKWGL